MKIKFFDTKNLGLSLRAIGTGILTGLAWILPMWFARYLIVQLSVPVVGFIIAILSIVGYLYTWGFIGRRILKIRV